MNLLMNTVRIKVLLQDMKKLAERKMTINPPKKYKTGGKEENPYLPPEKNWHKNWRKGLIYR
jgi:hypothetical protein